MMNRPLLLGLGILYCLSCVSAKITYDGYKVYRMWPNTEDQRMYLKNLEDDEVHDFWAGVTKPDRPIEVMVKPDDQVNFVLSMLEIGLEPEIFVENVNKLVDPSQVGNYNRAGMTWTEYFRIDDIYSWFDDLAKANPTKVSIVDGGSTFEGRQIKGVKISNGSGMKAVFFEGGIHAREWIGPATVTYIINELLTSKDPEFKQIADSFDWYLFPVTNPDGYEYSHTDARHWRKTRTVYPGTCRGADPNRNWNIHWMEQGASSNCSSDTYAGPKAFSELETASLSEFIKTIGNDLVGYISFHAYGQMLMVPYGHTEEHLDNYNDTVAIGQKGIEALAVRYGTNYTLGNIAETIYKASGSSLDWVKNEFGTPLVYVYELRDRGHFGAFLPPDQIIPNSLEIVDSLVAMFQEADNRGIVDLIQKVN